MNDYLISLFIDDEMDIDEKIVFVETVHASRPFSQETIALLEQEKQLLALPSRMPKAMPADVPIKPPFSWLLLFGSWLQPMAGFATALVLVGLGFLLQPDHPPVTLQSAYRFVVYLPQVQEAKIVGTFTDWQPVPLQKVGNSGYWSLDLKVPQGEHRYSYIVENGNRIVDPTVAAREHDDFGGENSVIVVGGGDGDPVS